jgi:hypothetical protein
MFVTEMMGIFWVFTRCWQVGIKGSSGTRREITPKQPFLALLRQNTAYV